MNVQKAVREFRVKEASSNEKIVGPFGTVTIGFDKQKGQFWVKADPKNPDKFNLTTHPEGYPINRSYGTGYVDEVTPEIRQKLQNWVNQPADEPTVSRADALASWRAFASENQILRPGPLKQSGDAWSRTASSVDGEGLMCTFDGKWHIEPNYGGGGYSW